MTTVYLSFYIYIYTICYAMLWLCMDNSEICVYNFYAYKFFCLIWTEMNWIEKHKKGTQFRLVTQPNLGSLAFSVIKLLLLSDWNGLAERKRKRVREGK